MRTAWMHPCGHHVDSVCGHLKQTAEKTSQVTAERTVETTEAARQKTEME
jgi:hypothetical protein